MIFDIDLQARRVGVPPELLKLKAPELYKKTGSGKWLRLSQVFRLAQICGAVPYLKLTNKDNPLTPKSDLPTLFLDSQMVGMDISGFKKQITEELQRINLQIESPRVAEAIQDYKNNIAINKGDLTISALESVCELLNVNSEIVFFSAICKKYKITENSTIVQQIRLFMSFYGYNQDGLAKDLGFTVGRVRNWFINEKLPTHHPPAISDLIKITELSKAKEGCIAWCFFIS